MLSRISVTAFLVLFSTFIKYPVRSGDLGEQAIEATLYDLKSLIVLIESLYNQSNICLQDLL